MFCYLLIQVVRDHTTNNRFTRSAALPEDGHTATSYVQRSIRRNRNSLPINMNQRQDVHSGANLDLRNESIEQEQPLLEEGKVSSNV